MKSVKITTQLVLLLLVILPSILAQEAEEFVLLGEEAVSVYQCTPASTQLIIQNNGPVQQQYFLQKEGSAAEWSLFETNSLILNPGDKRTVAVNFAVPCDASGEQYLRTKVLNLFGDEMILDQTIVVYTPSNINLEVPAVHEFEPCSITSFPVNLVNYFNFTETYSLSAESDIKASFSENEIVLNPGERKITTLTVDNADCSIFDKTPLNLVVKTKGSELNAMAEVTLQMKNKGVPDVSVGLLKTDGTVQKVSGQIKNTGEKREHYTLSVKDLDWVKVEGEKEFTIEPDETKEFVLVLLEPSAGLRSGKYNFELGILSERLEKEFNKKLNVEVKKPTLVQVFVEKYKKELLNGMVGVFVLFLIIYLFTKYFKSDFYKRRKLEREKRRQKLQEEQEKEAVLKQKIKEERYVNKIKAEAEAELRRKYKFVSKANLGKERGKGFFKFISTLILIGLVAVGGYAAYHFRDSVSNWFAKGLIYLNEEKQSINYAIFAIVAFVILLIVFRMLLRRKRIKEILVKLPANEEVNVPFWKKGITSVSFAPSSNIEFGSVKIKKQRTKELIPGVVYQSFTCAFDLPSVTMLKVRFRIPENFFKQQSVEELRLTAGKTDVLLNETDSDVKYRYYESEIDVSCASLTIYGKVKKTKEHKKSTKVYALVFFLLAVFILVITLVSKPSAEKSIGIPDQTWKQDEKHYLDLTPYFQDPDGDKMEFKASETKHVTVDIVDNIAVLIPEEKWTGQELITFFAEDKNGDFAKSNVVRLNVQKRLMPKELERYKNTIGVVGFFIALVVFLVIMKREFVSQ